MQASVQLYPNESSRIAGVKNSFEEVLGTFLKPLPIKGKQGLGNIDLAISGECKQVKAVLPALITAAHIQLAQWSHPPCNWPAWSA